MTYDEALSLFDLQQNFTEQEVKKHYRQLMLKWHPDVCKDANAVNMVYKIEEARKILSTNKSVNRTNVVKREYTHGKHIFDVIQM